MDVQHPMEDTKIEEMDGLRLLGLYKLKKSLSTNERLFSQEDRNRYSAEAIECRAELDRRIDGGLKSLHALMGWVIDSETE